MNQAAIDRRDFGAMALFVLGQLRRDAQGGLVSGRVSRDELVFDSPTRLRTGEATARKFILAVQRSANLGIRGGSDPLSLDWCRVDDPAALEGVLKSFAQN